MKHDDLVSSLQDINRRLDGIEDLLKGAYGQDGLTSRIKACEQKILYTIIVCVSCLGMDKFFKFL